MLWMNKIYIFRHVNTVLIVAQLLCANLHTGYQNVWILQMNHNGVWNELYKCRDISRELWFIRMKLACTVRSHFIRFLIMWIWNSAILLKTHFMWQVGNNANPKKNGSAFFLMKKPCLNYVRSLATHSHMKYDRTIYESAQIERL